MLVMRILIVFDIEKKAIVNLTLKHCRHRTNELDMGMSEFYFQPETPFISGNFGDRNVDALAYTMCLTMQDTVKLMST